MLKLLVIREKIKQLYSEKSRVMDAAIKFVVALVSLLVINLNIGAMSILTNPLVVLAASVVGAVLPKTLLVMMIILYMIAHIFAISPACAAVVALVCFIMYLMFFGFSAKQSYVIIAIPLLFMVKLPFLIPVLLGLVASPIAIIPMIFGTLIYFFINYFSTNFDTLIKASLDEAISMMVNMANNVFKNPAFFYTIIVFAAVICLVYFVKRLSVDYSWIVSSASGGLLATLAILIGCIIFDMSAVYSIPMVIIGGLLSTVIAWFVQLFVHSVDYTRTEYTQFEDDDYYYYVKAVPKVVVLPAEKSIKRINARKVNNKNKRKNTK